MCDAAVRTIATLSGTQLVKGEVRPAGTGVSLPAALTLGAEGPKLVRGRVYMRVARKQAGTQKLELAACKTLAKALKTQNRHRNGKGLGSQQFTTQIVPPAIATASCDSCGVICHHHHKAALTLPPQHSSPSGTAQKTDAPHPHNNNQSSTAPLRSLADGRAARRRRADRAVQLPLRAEMRAARLRGDLHGAH